MKMISPTGVILIIVAALLLFGPKRLPDLGRAVGKTMREFKNAAAGLFGDDDKKDSISISPSTTEDMTVAKKETVKDEVKINS